METTKLMPTLFYNGNYNRDGHRMRAVFVKEITDGTDTFRLWRSAGQQEVGYPRDDDDTHYLWIELHGILATIGLTMRGLMDNTGSTMALVHLFDGDFSKRCNYYDQLDRQYGPDSEKKDASLRHEEELIAKLRVDPAAQTAYIRRLLDDRVSSYLKSKENFGQRSPDFYGALVLNELDICEKLSAKYKKMKEVEHKARMEQQAQKERQRVADGKIKSAEQLFKAKEILRNGGRLDNDDYDVWEMTSDGASCKSYSIILYLMREYGIKVPLRTQGWINERLIYMIVSKEGRATACQYNRTRKTQKGSQAAFDYMNDLIAAVREESEKSA